MATDTTGPASFARILVALDGSPMAEQVLPYAETLARAFGATLTLLRVTEPVQIQLATTGGPLPAVVPEPIGVDFPELAETERRAAADYVTALAGRLRSSGLAVHTALPEGPVAETIVATTQEVGADLLAMTTHGRGGLPRLVFGSVADAVLRRAPCPVLLVRITADDRGVSAAGQAEEPTTSPPPQRTAADLIEPT